MPDRDLLHEPLELGPHRISGLFRILLPEDVSWLRVPEERFADCSICPPAIRQEYHSDCRCCGYLPHVPNLLLALALEDQVAGPKVRAVIADGLALPSGLWSPPDRFARRMELDATDGFGSDPSMACPFLDAPTGRCGVYAYRDSVCSTFFCVNDHGAPGEDLWSLIQALMGTAELAAVQWAMAEVGLSWELQAERMAEVAADLDAAGDGTGWTPEALAHIWGAWWGREEAFYAACVAHIRAHADGLWGRLIDERPLDAVAFEVALRDWVPQEHRHEVPVITTEGIERVPMQDLWYQLQLKLRQLWELPLDGEVVRWGPKVQIGPPSRALPLLMGDRHRVAGLDRLYWLTDAELALLRRFEGGRKIDSALLDSPEADAVEDARGLMAQWLRRGILVA